MSQQSLQDLWEEIPYTFWNNAHHRKLVTFHEKPTRLSSGLESRIYIYGRENLTECLPLLMRVGILFARAAQQLTEKHDDRVTCFIGVPVAGTSLAQQAALEFGGAWRSAFRLMRQQKKAHGLHQTWVEGPPTPDKHQYVGIENVVTTGKSLLTSIQKLEEDGYPTKEMKFITFIDFGIGGMDLLQSAGYQVFSIFTLTAFIEKLVEHHYLTRDHLDMTTEQVRLLREQLTAMYRPMLPDDIVPDC